MFNWFKKKIELKNENSIMSSIYDRKGTKAGTEIVVSNNFECLIYYKNKCYYTLSQGKYKIDKSLLPKLFTQYKNNKTRTRVKIVLHYVNKANHKLEIIVKKSKYEINFAIDDCVKFANLMLLYNYKVDNDYVKSYLTEIFEELIKSYQYNITEIPQTALFDYGIKIIELSHKNKTNSIFNNQTNIIKDAEESNNVEPVNEKAEIINSIESNNNKSISPSDSSNNLPCCPKCKYPIKFATKYCLRCGHQLTD